MNFEPYGPFKLPRKNKAIDRDRKKEFWDGVENEYSSLPDAIGCYVFALKAAKGFTPWYVGKTEKRSFKGETWEAHKLLGYNEVTQSHKGSPMLFLLAKLTKKGKFARATKRKIGAIGALEEMLIGTCLQRNKELLNKRTVRFVKEMRVPGYLNENPGKRSKSAKVLARLLRPKDAR